MPRQGIMLAKKAKQRDLDNLPQEVFVQPKLNGFRIKATREDGLLTSQGNKITSLPEVSAEVEYLLSEAHSNIIGFDGEIYKHGAPLSEVAHVVKRKAPIPEREQYSYCVFDVFTQRNDVPMSWRFQALQILRKYNRSTSEFPYIVFTHTELINKNWINTRLANYMAVGYEGIIIRHPQMCYEITTGSSRSNGLLKIKPLKTGAFVVVGYNEEMSIHGEQKDSLGSLELETDGGERFCCGSGTYLTRASRRKLWNDRKNLINSIATIKYPELTARGVPFHPVLIGLK